MFHEAQSVPQTHTSKHCPPDSWAETYKSERIQAPKVSWQPIPAPFRKSRHGPPPPHPSRGFPFLHSKPGWRWYCWGAKRMCSNPICPPLCRRDVLYSLRHWTKAMGSGKSTSRSSAQWGREAALNTLAWGSQTSVYWTKGHRLSGWGSLAKWLGTQLALNPKSAMSQLCEPLFPFLENGIIVPTF